MNNYDEYLVKEMKNILDQKEMMNFWITDDSLEDIFIDYINEWDKVILPECVESYLPIVRKRKDLNSTEKYRELARFYKSSYRYDYDFNHALFANSAYNDEKEAVLALVNQVATKGDLK